ncbi:hypothetical protein [Bacillus cereus group sp. BfR-BA-01523]|uniref:hypothetical protein n=1 Tax=Bacillus cereus group sp. BfR-BA-01523 TaxID=2920371 RepID=UPI001F57B6A3|nr:hypothetical protein [Bacillus cereus group sp. BfR-BA-01523]
MSEITLSMTVGISEWAKPVIEEVHKVIQKHEGKHLVDEDYNQLMNEIIEGIVQHAVYVKGNHLGIQIPKHNNNVELPPEGVTIKKPIEVDIPSMGSGSVSSTPAYSGKIYSRA